MTRQFRLALTTVCLGIMVTHSGNSEKGEDAKMGTTGLDNSAAEDSGIRVAIVRKPKTRDGRGAPR